MSSPALPPAWAAGPVTCLVAVDDRTAAAVGPAVLLLDAGGGSAALLPPPDTAAWGKPVACLAASPDGAWVAAGERGPKPAMAVWRVPAPGDGAAPTPALQLGASCHNFGIQSLAFSPSGRLLASTGADKDRQVVLWDPATGRQLGRARCKDQYDALALPSDALLLAANREQLALFALERCATPGGGSLKLTCHLHALPPLPAAARIVGLAPLPPANPRALPRLVAATDGGQLLRLRTCSPVVEKAADVQGVKVLALAAAGRLVAAACAGGEMRLFSAATLEPLAALPLPAAPVPALACALSADGGSLVASYGAGTEVARWDVRDPLHPARLNAALCACHREAISDVAFIPGASHGTLLASCSADGSVRLWSLGGTGRLGALAAVDLRTQLRPGGSRLLCLAASPDSQLLAAGDSGGAVHLLSLASPASPALMASQRVHDADVTCLACAAGAGPGWLLLAAGSRRGAVKVLQCEPDGLALLASLADHKAAVTGVLLTGGGAALHTAGADGRRLAYAWDPAAARMQLAAQAAVARGNFVGLAPALGGQAAVAATRAGRLHWDAAGREASVAALQKTQGELAAFSVDHSLTLAVCATSRNQLLALDLAGGKAAAPLAACKAAHAAGTAVTKVLISPDARWVVTAGEDAALRTFALPAGATAACLDAIQRLGLASPACPPSASGAANSSTSGLSAAAAASSGSSGLSSAIRPRRLEEELASPFPPQAGSPTGSSASAAPAVDAAAANAAPVPADEPAGKQPDAAGPRSSASVPASPNRSRLAGGREGMQAAMEELEALWRSVPVRGSFTGARPATAPAPAPTSAPPQAAPPAAAAGLLPSPPFDFGSPLQTVSGISIGAALQSPDVFADLESPAPSSQPSPAAPAGAAAPSPPPPSSTSSSFAAKLARLATKMRRSPAASPQAAAPPPAAATPTASSGVGAALDAVDAARCLALLGLSAEATESPAPFASPLPAPAAAPSAAAACSPEPAHGSATVDIGSLAAAGQAGSASVNQPRQRRSWGPTPGSEPRRTLSEASGLSPAGAAAQRPHSALGCEPPTADSFSVFGGSAAGTPASAGSAGSAPRRLSFSFDAAVGAGARRPAGPAAAQDGDTPSIGAKPGAAAGPSQPPTFALPADYASPGLPAAGGVADSTPRLFLGVKPAAPGAAHAAALSPTAVAAQAAAAAPPRADAAAAAPPHADAAASAAAPGRSSAAPTVLSAANAAQAAAKPRGLQGRPPVPPLNLAAAALRLNAGAGAAAPAVKPPPVPSAAAAVAAAASKRKVGADAAPAESSCSTGSSGQASEASRLTSPAAGLTPCYGPDDTPCSTAAPAAGGGAGSAPCGGSPASKKKRGAPPSPPRLVLDNELYERSIAKASTRSARSAHSASAGGPARGALWPAASGASGAAFSFALDDAALGEGEGEGEPEQPTAPAGAEPDPWSVPAAHDPLADELAAAAESARLRTSARCAEPDPDPASPAEPASSSPASQATSASSARSEPPSPEAAAAPTPASALAALRRGLEELRVLGGGAAFAAGDRFELAYLLAELHRAVDPEAPSPVPAPRAARAQAAVPPPAPAAGQENAPANAPGVSGGSGGGGACARLHPADLAALREGLLRDLQACVLPALRAEAAAPQQP